MARVTAPCRVFVYFCLPPVPVSLYRVPSSLCHQWTCVLLRHIPSGLLAPFRHIGLVLLCHNLAKVESHLQIASRVLSPLSLTSSLLCLRQHLLMINSADGVVAIFFFLENVLFLEYILFLPCFARIIAGYQEMFFFLFESLISKKEPACKCTYYALMCLTGTCKAFVRKFSVGSVSQVNVLQ